MEKCGIVWVSRERSGLWLAIARANRRKGIVKQHC